MKKRLVTGFTGSKNNKKRGRFLNRQHFIALNKTGDISPPEMCPLHHVLTLAGVLAEESSKEQLKVGCWDKGPAEALKTSGFKVFP
jgi:hypothetical protein